MQTPCRACGSDTTGPELLCAACAAVENAPMLGTDADPGLSPTLAVPGRLQPGDLTAAFEAAAPHAVLRLAAGVYTLRGPLKRRHPLTLEGAGPEKTRLLVAGSGAQALWHLHLAEGGTARLSNLTIALSPGAAADLLALTAGRLVLRRCRLEGTGKAGHGLIVRGDASLDAEDCEWVHMGGTGLRVGDSARARLAACTFSGHGGYGLQAGQQAVVEAERLVVQANGRGGLAVEAEAALRLLGSRIAGNGRRGVLIRASGSCRLEDNTIAQNAGPGVEAIAAPGLILDGNRLTGNRGAGMMLGEGARGEARANACEDNTEDGVAVYKGARMRLVGNAATRNGRFGFWVGSGGEAALADNTAGDNQRGAFMAAHTAALDGHSLHFHRRSDRSPRPTPEQAQYGGRGGGR